MKNFNFILNMFDANVQTTLLNAEGNDLSPAMKTYYNTELLESAKPNLVHYQFGKKVNVPQRHGKTVEWRRWSSFAKATTPLTEGETPNGVAMNVEYITAVLAQYGAYTTISDYLDMTAIDDVVLEATNKHGEAAGLTIDTLTRDAVHAETEIMKLFAQGTKSTRPTARTGLDGTCVITVDDIARAVAMLKKKNAPKVNGKYIGIIHPSVEFDLITSDDWKDVHQYAATTEIFEGEIGELYGVRFVVSTEAKIWKGGSTEPSGLAVYGTLIMGADGYGVVNLEGGSLEMIIKQKGSAGSADPLNQRSTVGWKVSGYAAKVLNPKYIVRLETCSSFSAEDVAN